jgi:hypothetical protein
LVAVLSMSKQEFSRLEVLLRVHSGRLRVTEAFVLIGLKSSGLMSISRAGRDRSPRRERSAKAGSILVCAPHPSRSCKRSDDC